MVHHLIYLYDELGPLALVAAHIRCHAPKVGGRGGVVKMIFHDKGGGWRGVRMTRFFNSPLQACF